MEHIDTLHCPKCGYVLALVVAQNKRTALSIGQADGMGLLVDRGTLTCPECRAERKFYSVPLSAIRLGIAEAA